MFELLSYISQYIFLFILHIAHGESFPKPLKKAEEEHYLELASKGDIDARNILVEHNLRLVAHIIKKYYQNDSSQDDLVSIGTIGLIKAINTFNPQKNIKLSSYASRCIENEILMHFRNNRKSSQDVSLNDTIDTDKDGNPLTLMDIMASDMDVAENVDTKLHLEVLQDYIDDCLTPREREIIIRRYGIGGRKVLTQRELAKNLNISRSYISRIEKKALDKLRKRYEKGT
ncbi:MAG: RNA polymerase sporulation sigma factor SigK [Ruminococcus sp.]|nr:RNA polymerase sporulation sigma factor SigK [Ruminococcus sp.]